MVDRIVCLFACFILVNALPAPSVIKYNIAEETDVEKKLYAVVENKSDYEDTDSIVEDPTWTPNWDYETSESDYSSYESVSDSYEDKSTVSYEENYSYESVVSDDDTTNKSDKSNKTEKKDDNVDADSTQIGEESNDESTKEPSQESEESNDVSIQGNDETESVELIKKIESRNKRFTKIYKRSTDESELSVIGKDGSAQNEGDNDKSIPNVENNNDENADGTDNGDEQTTNNSTDEETTPSTGANNEPTASSGIAEEDSTQSNKTSDSGKEISNDENAKTDTSSNDKSSGSDDDFLISKDEETQQRYYVVKYVVFINDLGISCNDVVDKLTGEVIHHDCPFQRSAGPVDYTAVRFLPVAGAIGL